MIELENKHIVLIFVVMIISVFIYSYDVYVIPKNEPICKPIYVTKRELGPEIRSTLNKYESETFTSLANVHENFNADLNNTLDIPSHTFSSFSVPSMTNPFKIKVIDSVIKVLSYIPTNFCEADIKQLIEYFAILYESSSDIDTFYKNVSTSTKIKQDPYNSKYSHLILYLIGKFNNEYLSCNNSSYTNTKCVSENNLPQKIISKNNKVSDYIISEINYIDPNTKNPNNICNSKDYINSSSQFNNYSNNNIVDGYNAYSNF